MSPALSAVILRCGAILMLIGLWWPAPVVAHRQGTAGERPAQQDSAGQEDVQQDDASTEDIPEEDVDDTPEVDTEDSIDGAEERRGWSFSGDLRPIITDTEEEARDGSSTADGSVGARMRLASVWGLTRRVQLKTRVAGLCFDTDCEADFIFDSSTPDKNGLETGQFTFDELFLHWFRRERFDVAIGRQQTRFVLRGGVYAKSLDRNDSNNVNVTWTDGLHATYRARNGWVSHLVVQQNVDDGTGSIRRAPLDFASSSAHQTYFLGVENSRGWGPIVQRAFDVSYLPDSLLKDGDPAGRREDYWGVVGRVVMRWPQRTEGPRLRAGLEAGYAPETPTEEAVQLEGTGDAEGFAWDVVASIMDFRPGHSIGLNYGRTGAGWLLSPQFRPNDELIELRYQWRHERFPLVEARIRQRDEIDQLEGSFQKRDEFDFYLRLTWQFTLKD